MTPETAAAQTIAKISHLAGNKPLTAAAADHVRRYFAHGRNSEGRPRSELIAGREGQVLLRGLGRKIASTPASAGRLAAVAKNGQRLVTLADVQAVEVAISGGGAAAADQGDDVVTTWLCDPSDGSG